MDIFEHLAAQHQRITALLNQIWDTPAHHAVRTDLFSNLKALWSEHDRLELNSLYAAVKPDSILGITVLTLERQHEKISQLIGDLENIPGDSMKWDAAFAVLRNSMIEHIDAEEAIYRDAENFLGRAAAEAMATWNDNREQLKRH